MEIYFTSQNEAVDGDLLCGEYLQHGFLSQ